MISLKNDNLNFMNIIFSQLFTLIILFKLIIDPYIIKRYAFGERFSDFMKEYYKNNSLEGCVLDIISNSTILIICIKIVEYFYKFLKINKVVCLSFILLILTFFKNLLLKYYYNKYNGSSKNILFFKEWYNFCFKETFIWHIIYYNCISFIYHFITENNYNTFYILLLIINIYQNIMLHN